MAETKKTEAKPKRRFFARLRYARISPRKMRYVVDLVRGKDYNTAVAILRHCDKRGAPYCKKLIESAYANAMDLAQASGAEVDGNALHLVEACVDAGPVIKRWRASSSRRPFQIKKRTCHVRFTLEEGELKLSKRERAKQKKQEHQRAAAAKKAKAQAGEAAAGASPGPAKEEKE